VKAFLAVAAVVAVTGCSRPGSEQGLEWTSQLEPGSVVHLRTGAGSIEVKRSEGQTAQIVGNKQWRRGRSRDVNFVVSRNGNELYVCAMWRNSGNCGARGYRGRNTKSFLTMFSLFKRTTDATADLIAELPANVRVDASNTLGDVSIDGIVGGVIAKTLNGDVTARDVGGSVSLESTNGDLEMSVAPNAALRALALNTTNGDIDAKLADNVEGSFDVSTVNGDVHSDFPLESVSKGPVGHRLRGQIGATSNMLRIRSVNGSVSVGRASANVPH
jgi:hypothetical protein